MNELHYWILDTQQPKAFGPYDKETFQLIAATSDVTGPVLRPLWRHGACMGIQRLRHVAVAGEALIMRFGPEVNLGNVAAGDILAFEALRVDLRQR